MNANTATSEIERLGPWFHNLHLPDGTQTCPNHWLGDFPSFKWRSIARHVPENLEGWRALDIGCNAGFYSFELARRGAEVTSIDFDDHYLKQARWAAGKFGLSDRIEFRKMQVYELARLDEQWDLVLFMGVLYHLRYPLLGLDAVSRAVRRLLIVQSLSMPGEETAEKVLDFPLDERERFLEPGWPKMAFIEYRVAEDPTNWWAPNHACMEAMLRSTGMRVTARPAHEIYVCEPDPQLESSMWSWNEEEFWAASGRNGAPRGP